MGHRETAIEIGGVEMRVIRSFLALKLNLPTVENLSAMLTQLMSSCKEADIDVRWVPPPNIHVTLRFLGQITEPMSHAVRDMLEPIVTKTPAFDLECKRLGAFPDTRKPRVIFAELGEGSGILSDLYTAVYERLLTAGFSFEDKPFHPHVTIGRVKHAPAGALSSILEERAESFFGTSLIRHFYCYQSDLTPHGAEYTAQWVLPFKRPLAKSLAQPTEPETPNAEEIDKSQTHPQIGE